MLEISLPNDQIDLYRRRVKIDRKRGTNRFFFSSINSHQNCSLSNKATRDRKRKLVLIGLWNFGEINEKTTNDGVEICRNLE